MRSQTRVSLAIAAAFWQDAPEPIPVGPVRPADVATHPASGTLQIEDVGTLEPVTVPALAPDAVGPSTGADADPESYDFPPRPGQGE